MTTERSFSLQPFPSGDGRTRGYEIRGGLLRRAGKLSIRYALSGETGAIVVPPSCEAPLRRDRLWEHTCFELFLAVAGASRYWEFNLSPAGHWNVYRFESYREGMTEEPAYASLPFVIENRSGCLSIALEAELQGIARPDAPLDVGVCSVVKRSDGAEAFWALRHCGVKADFHRRESFIIRL